MIRTKILLIGTTATLLLGACTPTTTETTPEAVDSAEMPAVEGGQAADGLVEEMIVENEAMEIDSFSYGYSEMTLTMSPGETKTFTLTNSGGIHDFVIDELGVASAKISEGETDTITISIPEDVAPGTTYAYYCSVGNHRAQGMEGVLTIE